MAAAKINQQSSWHVHRYPAIVRLWRTASLEFIPFLDYAMVPARDT